MSLGINSNLTGPALYSLGVQQQQLSQLYNEAASGNALASAAAAPADVAIYNALTTQAQGADTANLNITDATNAINVAQGATSGIQDALSQVNNLAIEANNGFNSPSDNAALQAQANQLIQQINTDANVNFNGTPLLNGANSGPVAATNAAANVTNNDFVNAGGGVLTSATASAATTGGTFVSTVDSTGNVDVTYTDSATQVTTNVGSFAANSSTTFNGTTLNFGNVSASDAGQSATVQTTAATAAQSNPTVTFQSGASAGQTTNVSLPNATTTGLGIQNIDLSNPLSATNAEGQINAAITDLGLGQATLGAQTNSLQDAFNNNNIYSNNLTASASAIGDANEASISSELNSLQLQQQISIATINNANTLYGYLNRFLSVTA